MARRSTTPEPQPARLTPDEMRAGIRKLERRINDLEGFDPHSISTRRDPKVDALEASIDGTLVSIFGANSVEYNRYSAASHLDTAALIMGGTPMREVIEGFVHGKERAIALLTQARDALTENLQDMGEEVSNSHQGASADPEGLSIIVQRGRLDVADPSPNSPYRYNKLNDDLPERVSELTRALTELVELIRGDNNLLNDVLKRQLLVLLETTAAELKAPYADTGKIRAVARTLRNVAESALSRGAERFIADKFAEAADGLADIAKDLL